MIVDAVMGVIEKVNVIHVESVGCEEIKQLCKVISYFLDLEHFFFRFNEADGSSHHTAVTV